MGEILRGPDRTYLNPDIRSLGREVDLDKEAVPGLWRHFDILFKKYIADIDSDLEANQELIDKISQGLADLQASVEEQHVKDTRKYQDNTSVYAPARPPEDSGSYSFNYLYRSSESFYDNLRSILELVVSLPIIDHQRFIDIFTEDYIDMVQCLLPMIESLSLETQKYLILHLIEHRDKGGIAFEGIGSTFCSLDQDVQIGIINTYLDLNLDPDNESNDKKRNLEWLFYTAFGPDNHPAPSLEIQELLLSHIGENNRVLWMLLSRFQDLDPSIITAMINMARGGDQDVLDGLMVKLSFIDEDIADELFNIVLKAEGEAYWTGLLALSGSTLELTPEQLSLAIGHMFEVSDEEWPPLLDNLTSNKGLSDNPELQALLISMISKYIDSSLVELYELKIQSIIKEIYQKFGLLNFDNLNRFLGLLGQGLRQPRTQDQLYNTLAQCSLRDGYQFVRTSLGPIHKDAILQAIFTYLGLYYTFDARNRTYYSVKLSEESKVTFEPLVKVGSIEHFMALLGRHMLRAQSNGLYNGRKKEWDKVTCELYYVCLANAKSKLEEMHKNAELRTLINDFQYLFIETAEAAAYDEFMDDIKRYGYDGLFA